MRWLHQIQKQAEGLRSSNKI